MNFEFSNEVFDLSKKFLNASENVSVDYDKVYEVAHKIPKDYIADFSFLKNSKNPLINILFELVSNSINYCYWYGRHDIRPNGSSSTMLYNLVENVFKTYEQESGGFFELAIEILKRNLTLQRFPLLEERFKHLDELKKNGEYFAKLVLDENQSFDDLFKYLITFFPGYSSDLFLKRASLFFCQVYRRTGKFEKELKHVHIPADYQVPKILESLGCISYSSSLKEKIFKNVHIPKYSPEECDIRAATILAAKELVEATKLNIANIDGWLWLQRGSNNVPFHLTVTTDY